MYGASEGTPDALLNKFVNRKFEHYITYARVYYLHFSVLFLIRNLLLDQIFAYIFIVL